MIYSTITCRQKVLRILIQESCHTNYDVHYICGFFLVFTLCISVYQCMLICTIFPLNVKINTL
uniref:Uncharacterized protein n=1 Tax=Anguilla anguilla TaxID=7936 RepID=A0A0E9Y2G9_ANGAN